MMANTRTLFLMTLTNGGVLGVYTDTTTTGANIQSLAEALAKQADQEQRALEEAVKSLELATKSHRDQRQPWRDHRGRRRDIHHRKA